MSKILIVDDDPITRRLLNIILTKADQAYSIIEADSGRKAYELVEKDAPAVILLDVMMPEMDGFEVCKKLKADEKYKSIPILFITGMERTKDVLKGFRLGAADYITKPINDDEVKVRVASHLAIKRAEEERIESENLRTLKDIVVTLNHNMNQPLMAAYTYINTALEGMAKKDEKRSNYGKIKEELDRLNLILHKVQSLEKVERTEYVGDTGMIDLDSKKQRNEEFKIQMKQVSKMAALGEFSAAVVHALNQPLTAISAYIEGLLMADVIVYNRDLKNKVEKIKDQFIRLSLTVRRVSEYSKSRFEAKMKEDINISLKDSLFLFEQQLKDHNIELNLQIDESIPKIYIDRYQIQDVIINLLVNARDAIDDVYHQEVGGKIKVLSRVIKDEGAVIAGIVDNGKPISEGTEENIFKSFFTTKDPSRGTGLGLAVCKDVLKKHNGLIGLTKFEDKTKVFYFVLPVVQDKDLSSNEEEILKKVIDYFNADAAEAKGK